MAQVLERIRRAGRPPFHRLGVAAARAAYLAGAEVLDLPRAPLPEVRDLQLPAADGTALAARWYRPVAAAPGTPPLPALLYFHGGGFTIGGLETHDSLCRQLARRSGAAVLALDYRLAPEHPFPTAVDDSWAALDWLATQAASLGADPARLAVGGDSAGGTLAAVAALHARDRGLRLAAQLLITPGTTAHADTPSHRRYAEGYLLDAASIAWFFDHYLPVAQRRDWRFAPLEAPDVDGVAPAGLVLAECDPLVDEGLAYADRLRAAGVPVALELARGMTHDFIKMGRVLPEAAAAQQAAADFLRQAFQETP
ncbi:alpha/beta hydrolase [Piscinibacter sakaiensis]|uniref:Lipase/esterase n=1 Tax=Piscinibacter sakaiensis TaxID=1547922 RepID=A0A0K8NWP6_PISS1|nr:alpha/beta hydrolase [Piscinibacter sakaiensis]GAP34699.1 lipase/esterase [Piscinibacter sakaiensis]